MYIYMEPAALLEASGSDKASEDFLYSSPQDPMTKEPIKKSWSELEADQEPQDTSQFVSQNMLKPCIRLLSFVSKKESPLQHRYS